MTGRGKMASGGRDKKFAAWLCEGGAEPLATTNPFEVFRWRDGEGGLVIYENKAGRLSFSSDRAEMALSAHRSGKPYPFKTGLVARIRATPAQRALLERDGANCFYCRTDLGDDITNEHLVPRVATGRNHLANLVLAHSRCNSLAGHLSVAEKIALRDRLTALAMRDDAINLYHELRAA